jgi:HD-GYP domain-containing protein (c-di-GMP phosphodiesterase class II)
MKFFAHTAEDNQGNRLPEEKWQPLSEHLRNVALLAKEFATPLGLAAEAELAGPPHDL